MNTFNAETTATELAPVFADAIKGRHILLTGCSPKSLALATAKVLAAYSPARLIISARDESKLQQAKQEILTDAPDVLVQTVVLDLGNPESIRSAVKQISGPIDVLYNSAGVMATPQFQSCGFPDVEVQFGVAHLGHFLLTSLIKHLFSDNIRIVNVTSSGHQLGPVLDDPSFGKGKDYTPWAAYGQAKSANCLFSLSIAQKYGERGWTSIALHPGACLESGIGRHMTKEDMLAFGMIDEQGNYLTSELLTWKTHSQAAATYIYAGFSPEVAENNGGYTQDCQMALERRNAWAGSKVNAEKLWALSERLVGQAF